MISDSVLDLPVIFFRQIKLQETYLSILIENHVITSVQVKVKTFWPDTSGLLQLSAVSVLSLAPCMVCHMADKSLL